jgi:acetoin utilization protein AcuB
VDSVIVADWMRRDVVSVTPHTSIFDARRLLSMHEIRHLPVVVDGQVVGMVSDRDIKINDEELSRALASMHSDLFLGRARGVSTVMTTPVCLAFPDDTIERVARIMLSRHISALPVVEGRHLVGIIGVTDCVRALLEERDRRHAAHPDSHTWTVQGIHPAMAGTPQESGQEEQRCE